MPKTILAFLLGSSGWVQASRLQATNTEEWEGFIASENVSFAGGFIEISQDGAQDQSHKQESGKCPWPPKMQARYKNERVVGSGATACVYVAEEEKTGVLVAIKVAKKLGKLAGWQKECSDMQRLRKRACAAGKEMLSLHEHFVPTCIEVGQDRSQAFYVMHAAGLNLVLSYTGVNALKTAAEKKKIFVQLWASVYALHAVGYTHNDLHGGNMVVDDKGNLALIDFGELKGHHAGKGYKHDINSLWQWSSVALGCTNSEWGLHPAPKLRSIKNNFLQCIKDEIGADDELVKAMDTALQAAINHDSDQHLRVVYATKFMKQNLPPFKRLFIWSDMDGCLDHDWNKIIGQKSCTAIEGYFKCPQESRPGACYRKSGAWDCWRKGDDLWAGECKDKGYDGACLYANHGKEIKDANEVKSCATLGECSNCQAGSWGACYVKDKSGVPAHNQCFCAATTNSFVVKTLLKHGCETKKINGAEKSYDGLCKLDGFAIPKPGQKLKPIAPVKSAATISVTRGEKLQCKTRKEEWKGCTVQMVGKARAKVRFDGFSAKFDKWVQLDSGDLKK